VLLCLIPDFYFLFIANLLLQDAIERIHVGQKYGDIHRGVFLIRGENVVLLGEFVSYYTENYKKLPVVVLLV
jgi:hypothetical protein